MWNGKLFFLPNPKNVHLGNRKGSFLSTLIFSILLFSFLPEKGFSQAEGTLYFMSSLPQSVYTNPAHFSRYRFSFGILSNGMGMYSNNRVALNDLLLKRGDSLYANLVKYYKTSGVDNRVNASVQAELLRISVKAGARAYFTWNVSFKSRDHLNIPKEMAGLFSGGDFVFSGGSVVVNPHIESINYLESGWSLAYKVNQDFTLGFRYKMLKGLMYAGSNDSRINLTLDNNNFITGTADVDVRTSGLKKFDSLGVAVFKDHYQDFLKNKGYGIDFGATYRISDRANVGFSVLDIGKISWKNDLSGYSMNATQGSYTTQGIDLSRIANGDKNYLNAQLDSINAHFKLGNGALSSFSTTLPSSAYLGGNFEIQKDFIVGLVFYGARYAKELSGGVTLALQREFGRRFTGSLSYTYSSNSFNNIGMGLSLNLAPLQIYVVGDNILKVPYYLLAKKSLDPLIHSAQVLNVRAGVNFVFGWDKWQNRSPRPSKKYDVEEGDVGR